MHSLRSSPAATLALLLFSGACEEAAMEAALPPAISSTDCDDAQGVCSYAHQFEPTTLAPGEERTDACFTYKLDNPTDLLVNTVELVNDGGFHHSNWFFVPEKTFDTDESLVRCHDVGF